MVDPDAPSRADKKDQEMYVGTVVDVVAVVVIVSLTLCEYRRHWLVVNIPGSRIKEGDLLTPYKGADPLPGSGKLANNKSCSVGSKGSALICALVIVAGEHRYVLILFKQPDRIIPEKMSKHVPSR